MSIKVKTIGPMTLQSGCQWGFESGGLVCNDALRQRFNIPLTAKRLWVTLTKHCPDHRDAIRVRLNGLRYARLDNAREYDMYILDRMLNEAADFGDDFYATIYYE